MRDAMARAVLLPLMSSARSTLALPPLALCAGVRDASTDFREGSLGPNYSRESLHNRFRGTWTFRLCRAREMAWMGGTAQAPSTNRHKPA